MAQIDLEERRTVIPRWRDLTATPTAELVSAKPISQKQLATTAGKELFERALEKWESDPTLVKAMEVADAVSLVGMNDRASEPLKQLAAQKEALVAPLRRKFNRANLRDKPLETTVAIRAEINLKKALLREQPRNTILHVEVARLYAMLGQTSPAEKHISTALKLSPDNRYTLRSSTRFYVHDNDPERALYHLRRSSGVASDPWIMAAEVAVSDLTHQAPQIDPSHIATLLATKKLAIRFSELASALGALEDSAGGHRRARKLIARSLDQPTENSLAQATWMAVVAKVPMHMPTLSPLQHAFEAGVLQALEREEYGDADRSAWQWLADEPFSARAAVHGSFINCVFRRDYHRAIAFTERALIANPDDHGVLNNRAFSLIMLGRMEEAQKIMPALEHRSEGSKEYLYDIALHALMAFRQGNSELGRKLYSEAAKQVLDVHPSLYASVISNWLENELASGSLSRDEYLSILPKVDKIVSKTKSSLPVWNKSKEYIENSYSAQRSVRTIDGPKKGQRIMYYIDGPSK